MSYSIGIISCVMILFGCIFPNGKIIIGSIVSVVQISFFTLISFNQLPLTLNGLKYLKYSNGYNYNTIKASSVNLKTD